MHCPSCGLIIGKDAPEDLCRCPRCSEALRVMAFGLVGGFERPTFVPIHGESRRFVELYVSDAMLRFELGSRGRRGVLWEGLLAELELERLKAFARSMSWVLAGAFRDPGPGRSDSERPFLRIASDLSEGLANTVLVTDFARVPRRDLLALYELTRQKGVELVSIAPHAAEVDLRLDHVDYDTVPDSAADVPALEKMWSANAERVLAELMETAGWHWTYYAADALAHAFGVDAVRSWRDRLPAGGRPWKELLGRYAIARARRAGLIDRMPLPRLLDCVLCRRRYLDAAIPVRLMELVAGRMDCCGRCLGRAFFAGDGAYLGPAGLDSMADAEQGARFFRAMPREKLHYFLRLMVSRVEQAERAGEPSRPSDCWLEVLAEQGYLPGVGEVVRTDSYFRAADGHLAASRGAAVLDNWLAARGISHRVDARYPVDEKLNPTRLLRSDLFAHGFHIEFAGMRGGDEFAKQLDQRLLLAQGADTGLVAIWADDLLSPEVLERKVAPVIEAAAAQSGEKESNPCQS